MNKPAEVLFYRCDALSSTLERAIGKSDIIINLLGGGGNSACLEDPVWAIRTYIVATQKIVSLSEKYHIQHLILSSSVAVYPQKGDEKVYNENDVLIPDSMYGILKLASEEIVKNGNVPFSIFRFANLFGRGSQRSIPKKGLLFNFIHALKNNLPLVVNGNGRQRMNFLHLSDACDAVEKVLAQDAKNEIYNVSTGEYGSINEIAQQTIKIMEKQNNITYKNKSVSEFGFSLVSSEKIRKKIGWSAKIKFEEGLREMIAAERHI